ncbi:MAG: MCE family protein [Gammaproteobacteria bacterium]|nr:MCE family protein [Gammaproteobacteria bacterium]
MSNKTNYYKIGLFTAFSITLVIAFMVFLGVSNLFKPSVLVETYFDESVQGLNIGSPVKYRGVTIGAVTEIAMVNTKYTAGEIKFPNQEQRYIYVQFSLTQKLRSKEFDQKNPQETINQHVKNGLRASLATQDLVGNAYLSLNFIDDKKSPLLPISWTPKSIYIPSVPSTLSQLSDNLSNMASRLSDIDFGKLINDFDHLTLSLDKSIQEAQIGQLSKKFNDTLEETTAAMKQVSLLSAEINQLSSSQRKNWEDTFSALRQTSLNLAAMSSTLKSDPSAAIFGKPVEPMDPSQ